MSSNEPSESVLDRLKRVGPEGARAAEMLEAASQQAASPGIRAGNIVAYCTREALMSLLDLGGTPEREMNNAARRVVKVAKHVREERAAPAALWEAAQSLEAALDGPGPHVRRLERAITALARRAPARAEADLLDSYVDTLGAVNALHGNVALPAAVELLNRANATIAGLFGPMGPRMDAMDKLAAVENPDEGDVAALVASAGDPRVLEYFFTHASGPGWLAALADHPLLQPPPEGRWDAYPYLVGLVPEHSGAVRSWLASRPPSSEITARAAAYLLAVARHVKHDVADAALRIVAAHLDDPSVLHGVAGYLEELSAEEHIAPAIIELLKRALTAAAIPGRHADDSYLVVGMLQVAISSASQAEPARWLRIMAAKLGTVLAPVHEFQLRQVSNIATLKLDPGMPVVDLFICAVRDVARLAARGGVSTRERLEALQKLPTLARGRLVAVHLLETIDTDAADALALLREEVAENPPMPETLGLLRGLRDRQLAGLSEAMLEALGPVPDRRETEACQPGDELPASWRHAYGWLDAMPQDVKDVWAAANQHVEQRWGAALPEGLVMQSHVVDVSPRAPMRADAFEGKTPIGAAMDIAAWRPNAGEFPRNTARAFANTVRELIDRNPDTWLAEDPSALIRALHHPTYVVAYLQALGDHAAALAASVPAIVDAVELVQAEPAEVERLGGDDFEFDPSWEHASHEAVELLGRLADAGANFDDLDDRVWAVISRAARQRDEPPMFPGNQDIGPLDHAVNRPSMRSLSVALRVAGNLAGDAGEVPHQLLALLDEALALGRPDGLHARAIIASAMPWLDRRAPEWAESRWSLLVGDDAPEGLGPELFDLYLQWGAPHRPLLEAHKQLYVAALARVPEPARAHLLTAMVWGVDGYDPRSILDLLRDADIGNVSGAAQWLAFSASRSPEMPLDSVLAFWRLALDDRLPKDAYEGFGRFSMVERLDAGTWLELTLETTQAADGQLELPTQIAERATTQLGDERALRIVAALLGAEIDLWRLPDIGNAGLRLLKQPGLAEPARSELRERLLEREFFEARDI